MKPLTLITLSLLLSACTVFYPNATDYQPNCKLATQKLYLDKKAFNFMQCEGAECLFIPVIVPAGSFIVSGSVVLLNNTLHWAEYRGRCDVSKQSTIITEEKKEIEVLGESCLLVCDIETTQCVCDKNPGLEPSPALPLQGSES